MIRLWHIPTDTKSDEVIQGVQGGFVGYLRIGYGPREETRAGSDDSRAAGQWKRVYKDSKVSLYDPVSNYPSGRIFSIIFHAFNNSFIS